MFCKVLVVKVNPFFAASALSEMPRLVPLLLILGNVNVLHWYRKDTCKMDGWMDGFFFFHITRH